MRRKISEVRELADELPDLTEQQMRFVEGILSGQKITESYKAAYDCSAMQQTTVWAAASRLRSHCKISAWISAARVAQLGHTRISLDDYIRRLDALGSRCEAGGNFGAAVQCEVAIGKALGHTIERLDVKVTDVSDELREIAKISPEAAQAYADEKGVTWQ